MALLSRYETSWGATLAIYESARLAMARGDYAFARARFARSLPLFEQLGDPHRIIMIHSELAHLDRYQGHYPEAEAAYRKTIQGWQRLGHRAAIAHQLESFAFAAQAQQHPERAAHLFAAAGALRENIGSPMNPDELVEYERELADLRASLDVAILAVCWAEGRAMSLEQAVAYAVGEG